MTIIVGDVAAGWDDDAEAGVEAEEYGEVVLEEALAAGGSEVGRRRRKLLFMARRWVGGSWLLLASIHGSTEGEREGESWLL